MKPKKVVELAAALLKYRQADQKVKVFEKINTALPKKKQKKFDEILKPLYAERTMRRYNFNQLMQRANKRDNNPNTN